MKVRKQERPMNNKGFTLLEVLTVTAILAIMIAIALPVYTSALKRARATTCAANRRAMLAEIRTAQLEDEELLRYGGERYKTLWAEYAKHCTCPDGGTFYAAYDDSGYIVGIYCSKHESSASNTGTALERALLAAGIKLDGGRIDSAGSGDTDKIRQALKNAGVDLGVNDVAAWAVVSEAAAGNVHYIWTNCDIAGGDAYKSVPVISYNPGGYDMNGGTGCYQVGLANVNRSGPYPVLAPGAGGAYQPVSSGAKVFQTFEEAQAYYLTLAASDNYKH